MIYSSKVPYNFIQGHETISASLDFLIFHLARLPNIQALCRQEVDSLYKSDPKGCSNFENLSKLKYLERCILESLRLTPTIPMFMRRLDSALEVNENLILQGKQFVLIAPWVVHRNPEDYPNPEVFDPSRFLPENVRKRHRFAFIPFSMGSRNCLGWRLALIEIKIIIACILREFEITTSDRMEDVKLLFDLTLKPERIYNVKFKRRII